MVFKKTTYAATLAPNDLVLVYHCQQFLCDSNTNQLLFHAHALPVDLSETKLFTLGTWDNTPVHLAVTSSALSLCTNYQWCSLRPLMLEVSPTLFKLLGFASQIAYWHLTHQFCGRCGHPTHKVKNQYQMLCSKCKLPAYPRLNPSMIVLVTHHDKILLARSPRFAANMYSVLAGFAEPGETIEECVHREVLEEVGITIKNIRYITSQNWPYPNSLMFGFHAEYESGNITLQTTELEDANWFPLTELPTLPPTQAISRYLIELYISEKLGTSKPIYPN